MSEDTGDDSEVDLDDIETTLEEIQTAIDEAETEADLDDIETDLEAISLPDLDDEDEQAERVQALSDQLDACFDSLEAKRGPYPSELTEAIQGAVTNIDETRWTEQGTKAVIEATNDARDAITEADADLLTSETTIDSTETAREALADIEAAIAAAEYEPDADSGTLETIATAVEALESALEDAQTWDDLSVREQLDAEGFYDVLDHRKDFPPEWNALKVWEQRGRVDMILLAFDQMESGFMEAHCLDALKRLGHPDAAEAMRPLAEKRNADAIEILGKIGDEAAVETILEYVDVDRDPQLQRTTIKALGEIGDRRATQPIANQLAAEGEDVRARAARALGMIGDPRAVEPLRGRLETDESDRVRAAAAWALFQIGTETAHGALDDYRDDRSSLVAAEAKRAVST